MSGAEQGRGSVPQIIPEISRRDMLGIAGGLSLSCFASASAAGLVAGPARTAALDIVDGQVHIGPDGTDQALAVMNALGIRSALLYEHWGPGPDRDPRHNLPGYVLPNGAWRAVSATATIAALTHPERFASVMKVDPRDPQLKAVLETIASTPYVKAIRVLPVWTLADAQAFSAGSCDALFGLAQDLRIPVFLFIPGYAELLEPYLTRFPRLTAIVDHCGMPFANIPPGGAAKASPQYFDQVLKLARHPNVALKWSHANDQFGVPNAKAAMLQPYLRRAIAAFGPQRIVWASDNTIIPTQTWSSLLRDLTDDSNLSAVEQEWILGRALRTLLRWDAKTAA